MAVQALPLILSSLPAIIEIARSEDSRAVAIKKIEAEKNIAAMNLEVARLNAETENNRIAAQREILQSMIDASRHAFDRKIDSFNASFNRIMNLIDQHHNSLLEEKKVLDDKLWHCSGNEFLSVNNRVSDIEISLLELKRISAAIQKEFNKRIENTSMDFNNSFKLPRI